MWLKVFVHRSSPHQPNSGSAIASMYRSHGVWAIGAPGKGEGRKPKQILRQLQGKKYPKTRAVIGNVSKHIGYEAGQRSCDAERGLSLDAAAVVSKSEAMPKTTQVVPQPGAKPSKSPAAVITEYKTVLPPRPTCSTAPPHD